MLYVIDLKMIFKVDFTVALSSNTRETTPQLSLPSIFPFTTGTY